jgi:hypothetical protein
MQYNLQPGGLRLTAQDKQDLIAFLKTLTNTEFFQSCFQISILKILERAGIFLALSWFFEPQSCTEFNRRVAQRFFSLRNSASYSAQLMRV